MKNSGPVHVRSVTGISAVSASTTIYRTVQVVRTNTRCMHFATRKRHRTHGLNMVHGRLDRTKCAAPLITSVRFGPHTTSTTTRRIRGMHVGPKGCISGMGAFSLRRCASRRCTTRLRGVHSHFVPFLGVYGTRKATVHVNMGRNSLSSQVVDQCNSAPRNVITSYVRFLHVYQSRGFPSIMVSVGTSGAIMVIGAIHLLIQAVRTRSVCCPLRLNIARTNSNRSKHVGDTIKVKTLLSSNVNSAVHISLDRSPRTRVPITHGLISCVLRHRKRRPMRTSPTPNCSPIATSHHRDQITREVKKGFPPIIVSSHDGNSFRFSRTSRPSCVCVNGRSPRGLPSGFHLLMSTRF